MLLKNLIIAGMFSFGLSGCEDEVAKKELELTGERIISEVHEITEIDSLNNVRGERVNGTGEGIFYPMEDLFFAGAGILEVGDKVIISWKESNYENENWEYLYNVIKMD